MNTLHVLMPSLEHVAEDSAIRRWLARGDRLQPLAEPRDVILRRLFHFAGSSIPVAALRHHCIGEDAGYGAWVCADPAYVRSEASGARMMASPIADLTADEAEQLAAVLRPLFGDAGMPLSNDTPFAWCLHLPGGTPMAEFVRPADAFGADLLECLPRGDAGRAWRRLFNEAQVVLHAHPVNIARVAAGKLPVNALWFWGSGALPGSVATDFKIAASDDDVLRGLAKISRISCVETSPHALQANGDFGHAGDALLDLDDPGRTDVAGSWLTHFQRWLRERRFGAIALVFASSECFYVRHPHRLRFWRRG